MGEYNWADLPIDVLIPVRSKSNRMVEGLNYLSVSLGFRVYLSASSTEELYTGKCIASQNEPL